MSGEATWPVPPLTVPPAAEADLRVVAAAESVRLFCDRARLARPGFSLAEGNAGGWRDLPPARRHTARAWSWPRPGQRADRPAAGGQARQQVPAAVRRQPGRPAAAPDPGAAIEWSHDLLSEPEQVCLRRLAIFAGGCTHRRGRGGLPDAALPAGGVFETVTALIDRSLLTTEERCRQHALRDARVRSTSTRRGSSAAGGGAGLSRRHTPWLTELRGPGRPGGPDQASLDGPARYRGLGTSGSGSTGAWGAWGPPGSSSAHGSGRAPWPRSGWCAAPPPRRRWLDAALAGAGPGADRPAAAGDALDGAGQLASVQADTTRPARLQRESLAIWREPRRRPRRSPVAWATSARPRTSAASTRRPGPVHRGARPGRAGGCVGQHGPVPERPGQARPAPDDLAQATAYYTAEHGQVPASGDLRRATLILGNLGVVAFNAGDFDLATRPAAEHLANARQAG